MAPRAYCGFSCAKPSGKIADNATNAHAMYLIMVIFLFHAENILAVLKLIYPIGLDLQFRGRSVANGRLPVHDELAGPPMEITRYSKTSNAA